MSDQRIPALDGLRGAAIAYVILGHFGPSWFNSAGPFGVAVFFALSGRLMADMLFIENMDWREFAVRRLARLYPALIFFLVCLFCMAGALGRPDIIEDWWSYPTFTVNIVVLAAKRFPPFDHLWSVSMEVQTYIVLAIIASCISERKHQLALLIGAIFCFTNGLVRTYLSHQNPFTVYWRPDVGGAVVFAAAYLRLLLKDAHIPSWTIPAAFSVANGVALITTEPWATATLNGVLLAFVAASAERSARPLLWILRSGPLIFLGTISYSLYIWQQLFMYAHKGGLPVLLALTFSFLTATFSYARIERPGKSSILSLWRRYVSKDNPFPTCH